MPGVRVSRRELVLLCRYVLVRVDLPLGYVLAGARLVSTAELTMGTGLDWLRRNIGPLERARPGAIEARCDGPVGEVDAHGESFLMAGLVALDLATIAARTHGSGTATVANASSGDIAPALTSLAVPRGLTAKVGVDGRDDGVMQWLASGRPGHPYERLAKMLPSTDATKIALQATAERSRPARPPVPDVPDGTLAGIDVDHDMWTQLLDMVGGTLPPDGRGRLTIADDRLLHDAGPGAGALHDDD